MKKLLITLIMFLALPVFADTMPFYMNSIPKKAIGMYQTGTEITLFSHPEANSSVIKKYEFSYKPETMPDGMFALLLNDKQLGFLYVSDIVALPRLKIALSIISSWIRIEVWKVSYAIARVVA